MDIFYDIETLPDLSVVDPDRREVVAVYKGSTTPPKSWKDDAKIAAWMDRKEEEIAQFAIDNPPDDTAWRRSAVRRLGLRILTIAVSIDDGDPLVLSAAYPPWEEFGKMSKGEAIEALDLAEADLLERFAKALEDAEVFDLGQGRHRWITYNGNGFDHTAISVRCAKYAIKRLGRAIPSDKWGKESMDLAESWKGTDYRGKMDRLTEVVQYLGGPPQSGIDGSQVFDAWKSGGLQAIEAHCRQDIADLVFVFDRMAAGGLVW